jgi:hypothetical protein
MDATRRHGDGLQRRQGQGAAPGSSQAMTSAARKEQQLVFLLTRQLVEAQFVRADRERCQRLWQEVAALELDPERITALMYGVSDHDDPVELAAVDRSQASTSESHRPAWLRWSRRDLPRQWRGAGRRGAPPAAPRAHRQAR